MTIGRFLRLELAVLVVGAIVLFWLHQANPPSAQVVVVNNARQAIRVVFVVNEGERIEIPELLKPGERRSVSLSVQGESSYTLEVTFPDGRKLTGRGSYIERGYECTEEVTNAGIRSTTSSERATNKAMLLVATVLAILVALVAVPLGAWRPRTSQETRAVGGQGTFLRWGPTSHSSRQGRPSFRMIRGIRLLPRRGGRGRKVRRPRD